MSSQEILWVNLGIGGLIALIFLYRSSQREPSRLRLSSGAKSSKNVVPFSADNSVGPQAAESVLNKSQNPGVKAAGPKRRDRISPETAQAAAFDGRMKSLNVIFNYNGHSWDAFEVLGIPAGAPPDMVRKAFALAIQKTAPDSHEFLKAALNAIQKAR